MNAIAELLSDNLPAEPTDIQAVNAFKRNVYPDVSPLLGLNPAPKKNVIVLQLSAAPTVYYLGVERDAGWQILDHFESSISAPETGLASRKKRGDVAKHFELEQRMKQALNTSVEWATNYYHDESVTLIK